MPEISQEFSKQAKKPEDSSQPKADSDNQLTTISVYGVTNRPLAEDRHSFLSLEEKGILPRLNFYREDVVLDKDLPQDRAEKSAKSTITVLTEEEFHEGIQNSITQHNGRLGVFIPGIRNAPGEAAVSAAQMEAKSGEAFVVEDWCSSKNELSSSIFHTVSADYESSYESQPMINTSLKDLANRYGDSNLDLVAHSRGSINLTRALAELQRDTNYTVRSATFTHSDIDTNDFIRALPRFQQAAGHISIISSGTDLALKLSTLRRRIEAATETQGGNDLLPDGSKLQIGQTLGVVGLADARLDRATGQYVNSGTYFTWQQETGAGPLHHTPEYGNIATAINNVPAQKLSTDTQGQPSTNRGGSFPETHFKLSTILHGAPLVWRDQASASPELYKKSALSLQDNQI